MKRGVALIAWLGLALAQNCSSVPAELIPTLSTRPAATLSVSPGALAASGRLTAQASVPAYVLSATLSVRGEQRWGDYGPEVLASWAVARTAAASFGPLNSSANGLYTFTLFAQVCYRLKGEVVGDTLTASATASVFIPWSTTNLPWLLWREAEAANYIRGFAGDVNAGQPMFIEGLVTGLAEPVRAILRDYLVKGYLNQGFYPPACSGWCYSIAPVGLRLYAVQGVGGLFQQGWASLGLFGGMKDSRSYELGTRGVAGVMIVRGYRHDYILLSGQGDFGGEVQVVEMPKGGSELFRKALSLSTLQQQAREVRP